MADHVGIYEIVGDVMPNPVSARRFENAFSNRTFPQAIITITNKRTFDRRTILRFDQRSSSSIAPSSTGSIPYDYGRGSMSKPPSFNSYCYISGVVTSLSVTNDYTFNFVIGEYGADPWETVHYNTRLSGTDPIENTLDGIDPAYAPRRNLYYMVSGKWQNVPPVYLRSYIKSTRSLEQDLIPYEKSRSSGGITSDPGADPAKVTVFTQITGNLRSKLGITPNWYLEYYVSGVDLTTFGYTYPAGAASPISYGGATPYLPVSSGTITGSQSAVEVDVSASDELLRSTVYIAPIVSPANDVSAFLSRQGYTRTVDQKWQDVISGMSASGTTAGTDSTSGVSSITWTGNYSGNPGSGVTVFSMVASRRLSLPASLIGSEAVVGTSATSSSLYTLRIVQSGGSTSQVGTLTFSPNLSLGSFSFPVSQVLNVGDSFQIISPVSVDPTLAGLSITIQATVL